MLGLAATAMKARIRISRYCAIDAFCVLIEGRNNQFSRIGAGDAIAFELAAICSTDVDQKMCSQDVMQVTLLRSD